MIGGIGLGAHRQTGLVCVFVGFLDGWQVIRHPVTFCPEILVAHNVRRSPDLVAGGDQAQKKKEGTSGYERLIHDRANLLNTSFEFGKLQITVLGIKPE